MSGTCLRGDCQQLFRSHFRQRSGGRWEADQPVILLGLGRSLTRAEPAGVRIFCRCDERGVTQFRARRSELGGLFPCSAPRQEGGSRTPAIFTFSAYRLKVFASRAGSGVPPSVAIRRTMLICRSLYRFSSRFASMNFSMANSISLRVCAADIWVRMRALPCGTTG
jgi:hypothetical protein